MTLAAFLAARLEEDEAAAKRRRWRRGRHRALAEAQAKRKILAMALVLREETEALLAKIPNPSAGNQDAASASAIAATVGMTLIALAEIYSGHPDYQHEWGWERPQGGREQTRQPKTSTEEE